MKRTARILELSLNTNKNNKPSKDLLNSTCTKRQYNEELSENETFTDTDSNYTPPCSYTSSDDSSINFSEALNSGDPVNTDLRSSSEFRSSNKENLHAKLSSHPTQESLLKRSFDSDASHISNSTSNEIILIESNLLKHTSSVNNKNSESLKRDETVDDNDTNKNPIPNMPSKVNKVNRAKDFCFYCESLVSNFARHLLRLHTYETDVQKFLSKPIKSLERKQLITNLRKKGNFIQNSVEITKPMRKQKFTEYLPCTNCLGFYSKKLLWKHYRKCAGKSIKNVQPEAQNLLLRNLKVDENLKNTVFPRMRADKISLVAKSDVLICAFGSQFLKIHREQHFVNVVSRKMRELAKLLLEIKVNNPAIKDFFDALKPENYDKIVAATKVVSKYDSENGRYESPTFAMNISTSIKQCCNIAIMLALKKQGPYTEVKTAEIEADLKTLIQIIDSNWKYDISSQAATDLNKRRWNKVTIIPLANDLKILKEFLNKKSEEASSKIKEGYYNVATYIQLLETVYCRVLLLNRRRPGELQRIKVHDYIENDNDTSEKYEEFDRALSVSERVLVKKFKRIVIRGKRGRGVPVLFSEQVQEDIKLLLSIRSKFVSTSNKFLFGNPGFENSIYGYKVLDRYSRLSGAKNPKAISSTRLRKHLATLSQMFSMNENDLEQLATFMGHTNDVHKKSYRLPDDVYQTAKISKLLLLMEDGRADAFKGKCLDEIDLDLGEELEEGNIDKEEILDYDFPMTCETSLSNPIYDQNSQSGYSDHQNKPSKSDCHTALPGIQQESVKRGKKRTLVPWTDKQKKVVTAFFKHHIKNKQPPKRPECETLKKQHPELLQNKDWLKIKVYVQNAYSKK